MTGSMTDRVGHLVRVFDTRLADVMVGVVDPEGIAPLRNVGSISALLRLDADRIEEELTAVGPPVAFDRVRLLAPIDGSTEVWAAGVTYLVSREARVEESSDREVYRRVYDADRPELFFKSVAWRVVTDGEPIGVRDDSPNNVPEPEVGLVLNHQGRLVGYTIVDDVSSRTIEGENPLYLPQAKVYDGCCAMGPTIAPRRLVADDRAMRIEMTIERDGQPVFSGESSTGRLKRTFAELARSLFLQTTFPEGAVLATGTSVVPSLSMTLIPGDVVEIEVEGLGRMVTPVASASAIGPWLAERWSNPASEFSARGPGPTAGGD